MKPKNILIKSSIVATIAMTLFQPLAHANLYGIVDPETKTIRFEGSVERLTANEWYVWEFEAPKAPGFQHSSWPRGPLSLPSAAVSSITGLTEATSDDVFFRIAFGGSAVGGVDLSIPIVGNPAIPLKYDWGSSEAISHFESRLAAGPITAANTTTPPTFGVNPTGLTAGPIILKLKETAQSAPDATGTFTLIAFAGVLLCAAGRPRSQRYA